MPVTTCTLLAVPSSCATKATAWLPSPAIRALPGMPQASFSSRMSFTSQGEPQMTDVFFGMAIFSLNVCVSGSMEGAL